jgi:hypothetical protein
MKTRPGNTLSRACLVNATVLGGLLILAASSLLSGCTGSPNSATKNDIVGVYTLTTVNSNKLPVAQEHEGAKLEIRSGSFTINADATCSSKMAFVPPSGREVTHEVKATYTHQGTKLTMRWQGAGMTEGTLEGDTFTMNNEGMILVYRK